MKDKKLIKGILLSKMRKHRDSCVVTVNVGTTQLTKVLKHDQYDPHATVLAGLMAKSEKGQMKVFCQPMG